MPLSLQVAQAAKQGKGSLDGLMTVKWACAQR
jgi:hypothetical protein